MKSKTIVRKIPRSDSAPPVQAAASKATAQAAAPLAEATVVTALAALAHAQRLRAFRALVQAGKSGLLPSVMAPMLGMPPSSLSFHLKELLHADLVNVEQQGRNLIYRADFAKMTQLMAYLTDNCCAADPAGGCC